MQQIQDFFRKAPIPFAVFRGRDLICEMASEAFLPIVGRTREELDGRPIFEVLPETLALLAPLANNVLETGEPLRVTEFGVVLHRNGRDETCYFDAICEPLREDDDSIGGIVLIANEVSAQVLARKRAEEGERQLQNFANALPQLVWIAEPDGTVSYYNERLLDFDGAERLPDGKWYWDSMLHEDDRQATVDAWSRAVAGGTVYEMEHRIRMKDGSWRWHLSRGIPQFDENGRVSRWFGTATDIHRQKQAEEELSYQKQLLETVTQNTALSLFLMDERQHCIYMNEAAEEMTGYSLAELQGKQLHYYIHHSHPDGSPYPLEECPIDQALPVHKRMKGEEVFVHRDGSFYSVAFTASPIIVNGRPVGTVIEARDTREEKIREQALRESIERYQLINRATQDAIWDWNLENNGLKWNEALYVMFGYSPEDIYPGVEWWYEHIHPGDCERIVQDIHKAISSGSGSWTGEYRFRCSDGSYKTVFDRGFILYEAGKPVRMLGSMQDVTERRASDTALKESEARLRGTFENAAVGIAHVGIDGNWLLMNQRLCEILGYSREELLKLTFQDITHPDDLESDLDLAQQLLNGRIPTYTMEKRYIKKNGEHSWVSLTVSLVRDQEGKPSYFIAVIVDINAKKFAEEQSRINEDRFRIAFSNAAIGMALTQTGGGYLQVNKAYSDLVGYSQEELQHLRPPDITHPDDRERNAREVEALLSGKIPHLITEKRYIHRDGHVVWVQLSATVIWNEKGEPENAIVMALDITEAKLMREQVKESEEQFRTLADSIAQLAWIADSEGWIFWYNRRWYEYSGTSFEEMQGWGWEKVHHPDHIARVVEFVKEAWKKGEPWELTFPLRRYDGEYRWFLTRAYPVKDAEGRVLRWIGTNTDIDQEKARAEELERHVQERTAELTEANQELERSNMDLEQFAYVASHDLKEPLRMISSYTQLLHKRYREKLDADADEFIHFIIEGTQRLHDLIADLLNYSRVGRMNSSKSNVDMNEALEVALKNLSVPVANSSARISRDRLPSLMAMPPYMVQLFQNLIGNAIKFSGGKTPEIHIGVQDRDTEWEFSIRDNGIGIEQEYMDRIFIIFQRLHTREEYPGTGIGLAICKKIVEYHGGRIWAESEPGKGTTFYFTLPKQA